jgi:hypothetical protein
MELVGTLRGLVSLFCGLNRKEPPAQSPTFRSTTASKCAPVRAATRMRSPIAVEAGPLSSRLTSSSVKGRSSSLWGVLALVSFNPLPRVRLSVLPMDQPSPVETELAHLERQVAGGSFLERHEPDGHLAGHGFGW